MKLVRTTIKDFRSIQDLTIWFSHGCEILLGINESGKSNILKALQLLDPAISTSANDLRIGNLNEEHISQGFVRFVFRLDESEIDQVYDQVSQLFLPETLQAPLIEGVDKKYTLREFVESQNEGVYQINLPTGKRNYTYWKLDPSLEIIEGWQKLSDQQQHVLTPNGGAPISASGAPYLQTIAFEELEEDILEDIDPDEIHTAVGEEISKIVKRELPACIYWQYSEQYLLPSSVDVKSFSANPDSCLPLKSMFELAGIKSDQVGATLSTAREQPLHRYLHLLNRVAAAATSHIHDVWREHKGIKIELRPHGDLLIPVVQDKEVPLDMANRSEGFKRFVSFLLLVSAKVRTKQLAHTLILVDEPEIGLHPRGARNLMNELIKIGETNNVVYSTHSIFMVDKESIDRHLIVEKKNELTTASRAEKAKVQDEDVLYSAIGYSIFEALQKKNVIFEGWRDKQVFKVCRDSLVKDDKKLKDSLGQIGLTFAEGVKDVRHIARFLELANRGCLIISDADNPGLQWQREYRRENGWGTWLTLQDILGPGRIITAEDLLTSDAIARKGNVFRKLHPKLSELTVEKFSTAEPAHRVLAKWLEEVVTENLSLKTLQDELKNVLFDKLKRDDLIEDAKKLVKFVADFDFKVDGSDVDPS